MGDMDTRSSEKGTISIHFVNEALVCLRERGLDPEQLLTQAGISPELLGSPQARVSSNNYGQLWHLIAQTLDDEFFGMDRHRMKAGSFTLLCHAVIHSDTLEKALRRALRFLRLIMDDMAGELQHEGDVVHLVLRDLPADSGNAEAPPRRAFAYGTYLIMLHGLACWLVGRRIPLLQADFRCPEPVYSGEWRALFSQNLNFDQEHSGIRFPAEYLAMANIQNERTMKEFLRSAPANFLVKYKNSTSLSARIRRRLREMPPATWPDFATLANQFHSSAATLRRRLDDEGQSYRSIMDDLRRDLAISLLSDTSQSIMDIASELGFAETSAFHRAFKKWTGARPGEYRVGEAASPASGK
jgi:AraC-like DNA-binding protein